MHFSSANIADVFILPAISPLLTKQFTYDLFIKTQKRFVNDIM